MRPLSDVQTNFGQDRQAGVAAAALVNRTHRVVRERARFVNAQKRRVRSLWIPLMVSFGMLALVLCAMWNLLDESEFLPDGIPDAAQQLLVISMWCLPLSVIVLAVVWSRRLRPLGDSRPGSGGAQ